MRWRKLTYSRTACDASTITENTIQPALPGAPTFQKMAQPTPLQRALDLLGVRLQPAAWIVVSRRAAQSDLSTRFLTGHVEHLEGASA